MKDLQNRIQQMLREKKTHSRAVALITALSLLMMIVVPDLSAIPGAAITTTGGNTNWNDGKPYFEEGPVESIPENSGYTDLNGKITSAIFTIGETTYEYKNGDSEVTIEGKAANPVSFGVNLAYSISESDIAAIIGTKDPDTGVYTGGQPYAYFQLDEKVRPNQGYFGDGRIIIDEAWSKDKIAGYFSISETGLIVFHYSDEYIAHLRGENDNNNGGLNGTVKFNANVQRAQDEGGDVDFSFNGATVHVTFDDTLPQIKKEGVPVKIDSDYGIDWKITITNPNGYVDLSQYTLSDNLNGTAIDWTTISDFTVTPAGAATTGENGVITLEDIAKENRPESIEITYRQTGVQLGEENKNEVALTKDDITIPDEKTVKIENGLNISKTGKPDYEVKNAVNDRIQWTIHVDHKSSDSLHNVVVTDENLSFAAAGAELEVYDSNGSLVDSSLYTISDNTLTFADNTSIPSSVDIVFWGAVNTNSSEASHEQKNRAKANRSDLSEVDTWDQSVTYNHNMSFQKELAHVNQETGNIEWQFTLMSNKGGNAKDDIYNYTIQDEAFQNLTQEQINSLIGFNVYHQEGEAEIKKGDQNNNGLNVQLTKSGSTLTITFDRNNADETINKIKLYYKTSIADYVGSEEYAKYQNGEEIGLYNSATATDSGNKQSKTVGPVGKDIKQRVEPVKAYEGASPAGNNSFGDADTADRTLGWSLELIKDAGFKANDGYTDELKSYDVTDQNSIAVSSVPHYFSVSQRNIIITGSVSSDKSSAAPLDSGDYTVTWYDASGNDVTNDSTANAVKFIVTFNESIGSKNYHHIYMTYSSTAKTSVIENGHKVKFSNGYDFGGKDEKDGLTFERFSPADVKNMTLSVKKKWLDNSNVFNTRPAEIQVKVYCAEADESGNLPASPEWKPVGVTQTLTVDMSSNEKTYQLGTEYPQWKYDETSQKVIRLYYKVEEVVPEGYTQTETITPHSEEPSQNVKSHEFSLTNKSDKDFGKQAIDSNGNSLSTINTSNVPIETVDIDGTAARCYIFGWRVFIQKGNKEEYTDTLPNGAYYIDGTKVKIEGDNASKYKPYAYYNANAGWELNTWNFMVTYNENGTIKFRNSHDDSESFLYYTAIPVDSIESALDENGNLVNKVTKNGKEEQASVKVTVTPLEEDVDHLTKAFNKGYAGGYLNYTIDVNPTGKKLSNTGYIDITDALSYLGGDVSLENLDVTLDEIIVYPIVDGQADTANPLSPGSYNYTVEYDQSETSNCTAEKLSATKWEITGWSPGDSLSVTLHGTPNFVGSYDGCYVIRTFTDDEGFENGYMHNTDFSVGKTFDNDGLLTTSINIPANATRLAVFDWSGNTITNITASVTKYYPAKLNISVPDQTPLRISYSYSVSGWKSGDKLTFSNTASFHADNGEGNWSTGSHDMNTDSSATAETNHRPKIYKVDVNNYAINTITSSFKVAKYINGEWIYANDVAREGTGTQVHRKLVFPTTPSQDDKEGGTPKTYAKNAASLNFAETGDGNIHEFTLDSGLYKFVEIAVESEYKQPDWSSGKGFDDNQEFVFYYAYDGYSGAVPTEATGKVVTIQKAGTFNIPNAKKVDISAVKSFSGIDADVAKADQSTVTLKLYWSSLRSGANMQPVSSATLDVPTNFSSEQFITYSAGLANQVTWNNLPTGKDGAPVYYFVREESYTYDGKTYSYNETSKKYQSGSEIGKFQPVYTKNGTNADGTVIEVNNSEGIQVKKLWVDSNGNAITNIPKDTDGSTPMRVPFTVRGEKDGVKYPLTLPVTELTSPSYSYTLPDEVTDSTGEHPLSYYDNFDVIENLSEEQIAILGEEWTSSTTRKISNGTGTLEIINERQAEVMTVDASVEKKWVGTAKNSIDVKLIQSTSVLTPAQLANVSAGSYSTISSGKEAVVVTPNGSGEYTFASDITNITIEPTGLVTAVADGSDAKKLNITGGNNEGSGTITVTLADSTQTIHVAVINQTATLNSSGWTKTWSGLPKYAADGTTEYHYYVIEPDVPNGYTASYAVSGQKTTITNTKQTVKFYVKKKWITSDDSYLSTEPIFTLMKKNASGIWESLNDETPTPTKNGQEWLYEYTDLDPGTYKVVESSINGYKTVYDSSQSDGLEGGNESNPYIVTNYQMLSLRIHKDWNDNETHDGETVNIKLKRTSAASPADRPDDDLIQPALEFADNQAASITLMEGYSTTVRVNKSTGITCTSNSVARCTAVNGDTVTIQGLDAGGDSQTTTLYLSDGTYQLPLEVTVTNAPTLSLAYPKAVVDTDPQKAPTVTFGNEHPSTGLTFAVTEGADVIDIDTSTGVITAKKRGTATVEVTYSDNGILHAATATVEVDNPEFSLIASANSQPWNKPITITSSPYNSEKYGEVTYYSDENCTQSLGSGNSYTVTADAPGDQTIYAKRSDGKTAQITVTFEAVKLKITNSSQNLTAGTNLELTATAMDGTAIDGITFEKVSGTLELDTDGKTIVVPADAVEGSSITVKATKEAPTGYYTSSDEVTFTIPSADSEVLSGGSGSNQTIPLNISGKVWKIIVQVDGIENMPYNQGGQFEIDFYDPSEDENNRPLYSCITLDNSLNYSRVDEWGASKIFGLPDYSSSSKVLTYTTEQSKATQLSKFRLRVGGQLNNVTISSIQFFFDDGTSKTITSPPTSNETQTAKQASRKIYRAGAFSPKLLGAAPNAPTDIFGDGSEVELEVKLQNNGSNEDWTLVVDDLLIYYDENQEHPYFYWVEEIGLKDGSLSAYKIEYQFDDGDAIGNGEDYYINADNPGNALLTIRNTPKDTPPEGTLPETGGHGTAIYYTIGGILLMLGAVGYVTIRRRRWSNE